MFLKSVMKTDFLTPPLPKCNKCYTFKKKFFFEGFLNINKILIERPKIERFNVNKPDGVLMFENFKTL